MAEKTHRTQDLFIHVEFQRKGLGSKIRKRHFSIKFYDIFVIARRGFAGVPKLILGQIMGEDLLLV